MVKNLFFAVSLLVFFTMNNEVQADSKEAVQEILSYADIEINGSRPWDIQVLNDEFYQRVLKDGSLGLGETYIEGWWDCASLDECMFRIHRADLKNRVKPTWNMIWTFVKAKLFNRQSKSASLKVIHRHYQLGNDLFELMLDSLMTYSCGYWCNASNLDEAQEAKYDLIARKLGFQKGMTVLDIGCGWGDLQNI